MRLLSQKEAQSQVKKQHDELVQANLSLLKVKQHLIQSNNDLHDDYDPQKAIKQREFDRFCELLQDKKSSLLAELQGVNKLIEERKSIYYGLVEKQDALHEKMYEVNEANAKLDLRQKFVEDLEKKWHTKQNI